MPPKPYFWAIFPIFRLIFCYFPGEAEADIFHFFPISGRRPEIPVLAGGQGRKVGVSKWFPIALYFSQNRGGNRRAFTPLGEGGDCMVEPLPGHIRCRECSKSAMGTWTRHSTETPEELRVWADSIEWKHANADTKLQEVQNAADWLYRDLSRCQYHSTENHYIASCYFSELILSDVM